MGNNNYNLDLRPIISLNIISVSLFLLLLLLLLLLLS